MFLICSKTKDAFCDRSPIDGDCAESYRRAVAKISYVGPERQEFGSGCEEMWSPVATSRKCEVALTMTSRYYVFTF